MMFRKALADRTAVKKEADKMKKLFVSALLTMVMATMMAIPALAEENTPPDTEQEGVITILPKEIAGYYPPK